MRATRRGRIRILALATTIAVGELWLPVPEALQQERIELKADDSTPLATVLTQLQRRYGWVITYEDTVYEHSSELRDVSRLTQKPFDPSKPAILAPRGGAFSVEILPGMTGPMDAFQCVRRVVDAYNESGNPGRFQVLQTEDMVHVLPLASRDANGQLVDRKPVLATRIAIPAGRRTAASFLNEVVTALQAAGGVKIGIMAAPSNVLAAVMVQPEVTDDLALNILARELQQIAQAKLSWRLLYSPDSRSYMLTVYVVHTPR